MNTKSTMEERFDEKLKAFCKRQDLSWDLVIPVIFIIKFAKRFLRSELEASKKEMVERAENTIDLINEEGTFLIRDAAKKLILSSPKDWILSYQKGRDMHKGTFIEAICSHGVGHHKGIHGCHLVGNQPCCKFCPKKIWDKVSKD